MTDLEYQLPLPELVHLRQFHLRLHDQAISRSSRPGDQRPGEQGSFHRLRSGCFAEFSFRWLRLRALRVVVAESLRETMGDGWHGSRGSFYKPFDQARMGCVRPMVWMVTDAPW